MKFSSLAPEKMLQLSMMYLAMLGIVTAFALLVGALIAAAYLVNLLVTVLCSVSAQIALLYGRADSLTQLLMIVLAGFVLWKLIVLASRCETDVISTLFEERPERRGRSFFWAFFFVIDSFSRRSTERTERRQWHQRSQSKRALFLLQQWRAFLTPWRYSGVKG